MQNWTEEELEAKLKENPELKIREAKRVIGDAIAKELDNRIMHPEKYIKPHKYHVASKEKRTYNGHVFHSLKEAQHAADNDTKIKAGIMDFYLTQVPIELDAGFKYRLDFLEFSKVANTHLYEVHWIEVKGYKTRMGELKRKQAEAKLGIEVEVV